MFHAERSHGLIIHDLRDNFGPELSALRLIRDKTKRPVYFIKYAVGGSGLNEWQYTYTPRLQAEIALTGRYAEAWFWMQGETDANWYGSSSTYQTRLAGMVDSIGARFIACQISDRWAYASTVQQALENLNNTSVISLIDSDLFPVYDGPDTDLDGLNNAHYTVKAFELWVWGLLCLFCIIARLLRSQNFK